MDVELAHAVHPDFGSFYETWKKDNRYETTTQQVITRMYWKGRGPKHQSWKLLRTYDFSPEIKSIRFGRQTDVSCFPFMGNNFSEKSALECDRQLFFAS